jgi:hypothetical protein
LIYRIIGLASYTIPFISLSFSFFLLHPSSGVWGFCSPVGPSCLVRLEPDFHKEATAKHGNNILWLGKTWAIHDAYLLIRPS